MSFLNVEIKAKIVNTEKIRAYLIKNNADFRGLDEQTDTYFNVPNGRLKLREGKIENNLIYYERSNQSGPKDSNFQLVYIENVKAVKEILVLSMGILTVVKKRREIFFIDNVKFHIDEVATLGSFIEIEAGNMTADLPQNKLKEQCNFYMRQFEIKPEQLIAVSYSDMLLKSVSG